MQAENTKKRRKRRSPEEIIAALEREIDRVKTRAQAKELKKSPAHKAALTGLKALDKALGVAADEGETSLQHSLADARKALAGYFENQGLPMPKARMPRGRRPKD